MVLKNSTLGSSSILSFPLNAMTKVTTGPVPSECWASHLNLNKNLWRWECVGRKEGQKKSVLEESAWVCTCVVVGMCVLCVCVCPRVCVEHAWECMHMCGVGHCVHACECICLCMCLCVVIVCISCLYVCLCVYLCEWVCLYVTVCVPICECVCACVWVCVCLCAAGGRGCSGSASGRAVSTKLVVRKEAGKRLGRGNRPH